MALTATMTDPSLFKSGREMVAWIGLVPRRLRALEFEPRMFPAIYVKPFAKEQKNDDKNAEAIAEAALRPNLKLVKEKTLHQLDLQTSAFPPKAETRCGALKWHA